MKYQFQKPFFFQKLITFLPNITSLQKTKKNQKFETKFLSDHYKIVITAGYFK